MRFIKIFTFLFLLILCSVNAMALTNQQRAYLMNEKGYSAQQVGDYERRAKQRMEDRKAGKTPSALTEEDNKILNDAKAPEAATYGNENPGMLDRFGAWFAESTGMADKDITGTIDTLNTVGQIVGYTGAAVLAGATGGATAMAVAGAKGVALGSILGRTTLFGANEFLGLFYSEEGGGIYNKILSAFKGDNNGCWFCPVFTTLFNTINTITTAISTTLRDDFIKLLSLGILFYILFKVLKAVISFGEINPSEFFKDLFIPVVKATLAVLLLYNLGSLYHYAVNPLTELSIGFATNIGSTTGDILNTAEHIVTSPSGTTNRQTLCSISSSSSFTSTTQPVFEKSVDDAFQCFIKTISSSLIVYMAVAASFIADCWKPGVLGGTLPNFELLFGGIALFIPLFMIFISLPLKLLDSMFRLMFVSALMPLWVILWVLPPTQGYSKKAFDMFLNVLVTFVCLSVIMLMVLILLGSWTSGISSWADFMTKLQTGHTAEAFEMINFSTSAFFIALAMTFLAFSLVGKTEEFANNFVGGAPGGGMGAGLEKLGMAGVGLVGSKVAKPLATKAAKNVGKGVGMVADGAVSMVKNSPRALGFAAGRIASRKPIRASDFSGLNPHLIKKTKDAFREGYQQSLGQPATGGNTSSSSGSRNSSSNNSQGSPTSGNGADEAAKRAAEAAKRAAEEAKRSANSSEKFSEEAKKTIEEAKNALDSLGKGDSKSFENLLKDPANIASILSAISGGGISPALATTGVKVVSSVLNEQFGSDKTKESTTLRTMNALGQTVQENIESIIRDKAGNILSTISKYELINPETKAASAMEIERDLSGKIVSFMKEVKEENGQLIEKIKTDLLTGKTTNLLNNP